MATIINDRDILLQASSVRLVGVTGLPIILTPTTPAFTINNNTPDVSSITIVATLAAPLAGNVTWSIVSGTISGSLDTSTANQVIITYAQMTTTSVTIRASLTFSGTTYTADYVVSYSTAARLLLLSSSGISFSYADSSATTSSSPDITFTTVVTNVNITVTGNPTYVATAYNSSNTSLGTVTLTGSGLTRTLTATNFNSAGATTTTYVKVVASYATPAISDTITITRVNSGATGTRGSVQRYISGSSWSDASATAAVPGGSAIIGDTVTISNGSTFVSTKVATVAGTSPAWTPPGAVIDGNLLVSGSVTSSAINSNNLTIRDSGGTIILGAGTNLASTYIASVNANTITAGTLSAANININSSTSGLPALQVSVSGAVNYYSTLSGYNLTVSNTWTSSAAAVSGETTSGEVGVYGWCQTAGGFGHGVRGSHTFYGSSGLVGSSAGYDFYAEGSATNYGPFTGAHDALISKSIDVVLGDICIDIGVAIEKNISNTICFVEPSSLVMQKGCVGIFSLDPKSLDEENPPAAMYETVNDKINTYVTPHGTPGDNYKTVTRKVIDSIFYEIQDTHNRVNINALGEGQVNVCGENGNLEIGDFITTSSIPGKGMKQLDDLLHNYTVAKCRENVTFDSPTQVKLVACIYLCG